MTMRIVDTHLHLMHLDRFNYPWLKDIPAINRQWTAESFFAEAEKLGIETALHMECDVEEPDQENETRFVLDHLHPGIAGAIAAARPERADFPAHLDRIAALRGVKGIRRILHTQPDELSQSKLFAANLRRLAPLNLTFDLCVLARQLGIGRDLVASCPDVQFVLDHCGVPDIAGNGYGTWASSIERLAELPNVVAKISGVVAYANADWSVDDIRPYVEHVIECFGWGRVVWGSDYPVVTLTANLTRWVEVTKQIISAASVSEQSALLSRNAERIYKLKRAPKRYGSVVGIKPEAIADYKRLHADVWPKVLERIQQSHITNYSIYLRQPENLIFAYFEYTGDDYDADMAAMAADPLTQDWWKGCMPLQSPLASRGECEWWAAMEEVFHVD
jgi:predicted TIM-barrel fold metal-dependent hydrolase/L-rhamnose mutarotase